jgi:chromosome segregation ATPase
MKKDRARTQTDKRLESMEKEIGRVYQNSPAMKRIVKKFNTYMKDVQDQTADLYDAYMQESDRDEKIKKKKAYSEAVQELTLRSKEYRKILKEFTQVMAETNQQALKVANDAMVDIYVMNYNQVADECRKVGIKVNGEK